MNKPTYILGISAFYHDSAACLVKDGEIVFAAQEERFSRIKNDASFPAQAIQYALQASGLTFSQIDHVAYYDKPLLTFERLLETWLSFAPKGWSAFCEALPIWLHQKLRLSREIDQGLENSFDGPLAFLRHHQSHAASAFFPSPFDEAAILTMDGVGEWSTTTIGAGSGNRFQLTKEIRFPHSLGLLYSAFTYYLGFKVNSGEYKVMGLAPYGRPLYAEKIKAHLIDIRPDGSFWMDMKYFDYCDGLTMTGPAFEALFAMPTRDPDAPLEQRHMDMASSIQKVCEEVMILLARHARDVTGADYLCMAGGCALNCVANGLISREGIFKKIFVQPAAGDAGGALGAALFNWHQILGNPRKVDQRDTQKGSLLGPCYDNPGVETELAGLGAVWQKVSDSELADRVSGFIEKGKIVGFFYGAMEFGPRALGARSILGDARRADMQSVMNQKIKFRESFRPFAPVVLEELAKDYFDLNEESPYMMLVAPVASGHRKSASAGDFEQASGFDLLKIPRSDIPAVTHVDYSARVQTLTAERNGMFYNVVKSFYEKTGCPVMVNTSFNIRGEPIVNTPEQAYRCFMFTDIDILVVQDCILYKENQPAMPGANDYKARFRNHG